MRPCVARDETSVAPRRAAFLPMWELSLGVIYFTVAASALLTTRLSAGIALVSPANALAAALLIRSTRVHLPGAALGVFTASTLASAFIAHRPWPAAVGFAGINLVEIALMVWTFRFLLRFPYPALSVEQAAVMTAIFGIAIPGVMGLVAGSLIYRLTGLPLSEGVLSWWAAHALGACLVGPPIILFSPQRLGRLAERRFRVSNAAILLVSLLTCLLSIRYVRFPFAVIGVPLLIAAFRVGAFGAALLSLASGAAIVVMWSLGLRPEGLEHVPVSSTLATLPVIALLSSILPPIAVGLGTDARRQALRRLNSSERRFRVTLSTIADAVITTDVEARITYINAAGERLLGQTAADLQNRRLDEVMSLTDPTTSKSAPNLASLARVHGTVFRREAACVLHRPDGIVCYVRDVISPVLDSKGTITGLIVALQDATADFERTREITHRASHDSLTGLVNRFEFQRRLRELFRRARHTQAAAAVIAIDLDRFKAVNDAGGHAAGDAMLKRVSGALCSVGLRQSDTIARLGGDEFAVLLENCPESRCMALAAEILAALNPLRLDWNGGCFEIGASIGVAALSAALDSDSAWMAAADQACYRAKRAGRGQLRIG